MWRSGGSVVGTNAITRPFLIARWFLAVSIPVLHCSIAPSTLAGVHCQYYTCSIIDVPDFGFVLFSAGHLCVTGNIKHNYYYSLHRCTSHTDRLSMEDIGPCPKCFKYLYETVSSEQWCRLSIATAFDTVHECNCLSRLSPCINRVRLKTTNFNKRNYNSSKSTSCFIIKFSANNL